MKLSSFLSHEQHTIQQRLLSIILFVSASTLLIAIVLLTFFHVQQSRESMVDELMSMTKVIANNTKTAVGFGDAIDAKEVLLELRENTLIDAIVIYDVFENVFVQYARHEKIDVLIKYRQQDLHEFRDNHLFVNQLIEDETGKLGDVYVQANLDKLNQQIFTAFQVVLIIFVLGVLVSYFLSIRLQKNISAPLLNLSKVTRNIRESGNYNEHVAPSDIAEIDQVREEFNSLLEQISIREEDLKHLASHDVLTKLPNRAYFTDILINALIRGMRKSHSHAILFIDLDRFKNINDSLGHTAGDSLLEKLSLRLSAVMRNDDLLARLGGDEFTILLQEIAGEDEAIDVARRIIDSLNEPFKLSDHNVVITPSIGIVVYPDHGATPEVLMKNADTAMYSAKHGGGNNYVIFNHGMDLAAKKRLSLEEDIRKGIAEYEFFLMYQPQVSIEDNKINGFESLCRWKKVKIQLLALLILFQLQKKQA